jgi:hypothetical protein
VIEYSCGACGQPVSGASGGRLWISRRGFQDAGRKLAEWDSGFDPADGDDALDVDLVELMSMPDPEPWRISHGRCIADETAYGLDLPQDHQQWLAHIAHLRGKAWISATDLDELIEEAATNTERCALVPPDQGGVA